MKNQCQQEATLIFNRSNVCLIFKYCATWIVSISQPAQLNQNSKCFCQQEVFEARYLKVPQTEALPLTHHQEEKTKRNTVESMSTSTSSDSESSSETQRPPEEVAMQLASLEERVGIYTPVKVHMAFEKLITAVHFT